MIFTPEDFDECDEIFREGRCQVAEKANAMLKEWLDKAPTVYAKHRPGWPDTEWQEMKFEIDAFRAKLVCIEEIKK